jgi:Xaa-Pro aminopeptidase
MRYHPISPRLFVERRQAFIKKMKPNSIAIFFSNDPAYRSGDQFFPFRQDSALFSISGLDQSGSIIILYPEAKNLSHREIAFIQKPDPEHAIWNGDRLSIKEAKQLSGIRTVKTTDQWKKMISSLIPKVSTVYINTEEQKANPIELVSQIDHMADEIKRLNPRVAFKSIRSIMQQLSMIKHPLEIELMKEAIRVTGLAFDRILRTIKPNMKEFEVEAELSYILIRNGCQHAFEPIVASGKSACTLHYIRNDHNLKRDSLVLLDFGAEYAYMASDMTRTIPVSGKYSKRQKEVYNSVLRVLNEMTAMMHPGIKINQLNAEAGKLIESELTRLKIISKSDIRKQDRKMPLWKKYFMHGISHHLGYDVHDVSDRSSPLKANMVLTCEPGIYIPAENLGIRLENDILITKKGPSNLMESIPIDPDEIESIMHSAKSF